MAEYLDLPLEHDPKVADEIRAFFRQRNRAMSENNLLQALVPRGATVLENLWGTAPGLYLSEKGRQLFLLPGVPREMKALFENAVLPLLKREDSQISLTRILRFYGVSESSLDEKIADLLSVFPQTVLAPYAKDGEVELHVTAIADSQKIAEERLMAAEKAVLERLGAYCYGFGDTSLEKCLVEKLNRLGLSVATAESCTGGMLSQRITAIPGASAVLAYGVCTYSEEAKKVLLSVTEETLSQKGVYSEACASEMAEGIRRLSNADIGVGITGVAGPDGGDEKNPVGTVYIALSSGKYTWVEKGFFATRSPDRDQIRRLASSKALSMLLSFCEKL